MTSRSIPLVMAVALILACGAGPARAGGTSLDGRDDDHDHGPSIIGWVREVGSLAPLENAKVMAEAANAAASIVTRTDPEGRFRFAELGEDMPLDAIELTCSRDAYTMVDVIRRRLSSEPRVPLEVECVMVHK